MTISTTILLDNGASVYMRGKLTANNTALIYSQFNMSGSIEAKGILNTLWDYENWNATLKQYCGYRLFSGCAALTSAPELPSETLTQSCYYQMFYQCSQLSYIKCLATNVSSNYTSNWVKGVASSGTFVKSESMSSWTVGNNGIPNGWTMINDTQIPTEIETIDAYDPPARKVMINNQIFILRGEKVYTLQGQEVR